ncbi:MAG: hypothetical protein KF771_00645 [Burkholderiales bacterium]|nr:hypothetical protein [Burkholderiales bacterium]
MAGIIAFYEPSFKENNGLGERGRTAIQFGSRATGLRPQDVRGDAVTGHPGNKSPLPDFRHPPMIPQHSTRMQQRLGCAVTGLLLLATATAAPAAIDRQCLVSVQVSNGRSIEQQRRVTFATGLELSRITRVMHFDFHRHYAVIWHGRGLPTVVRIDAVILGVGREFSAADFERLFGTTDEQPATQIEGEGQSLQWRIRARTAGGWIDPAPAGDSGRPH